MEQKKYNKGSYFFSQAKENNFAEIISLEDFIEIERKKNMF